jgi:glycosyltransferase involved in cell wall biosynthesis
MVHDHQLYCLRGYKYDYFSRKPCMRSASGACVLPCLGVIQRNRGSWFPLKLASFREKQQELALNRRAAAVLTYSNYCRQELIRNRFDPGRIHLFAPIPSSAEVDRPRLTDRDLILFAGQIIRGKGVDVLLRALRRVTIQFECRIVGDGTHRTTCERLSRKLGLEKQVTFTGYVPPGKLSEFYREASVFAVSSVWPEPFGMVGPEAMLHGLPVVAFNVGGVCEWLLHGETGFLVDWMDVAGYAWRLEQLLLNKELAHALGQRGREHVLNAFDVPRQVNLLEEILLGVRQPVNSKRNETTAVNVVYGIPE